MLRVTASTSAKGAQAYFDTELSKGDYYVKGQGVRALWHGRGAKRLGLSGEVTRAQFAALTENLHPETGERLTARTVEGRRAGYDLTFSAKKSVSILYAYTGDERILDAFRDSVRDTMHEIEGEMHTRVRKGGKDENRRTGNMLWADFTHFDSRPIDGIADPHLHCHAYAFNASFDEIEGQWKAGEFGGIKRDAPYYEAAFDARFARHLEGLGYATERQGRKWELAGLEPETLDKFSRRTAEVEAEAAEKGLLSGKQKDGIAARNRAAKTAAPSREATEAGFLERLTPEERRRLDEIAKGSPGNGSTPPGDITDQSIAYALAASFERKSVMPTCRVLEKALRFGVGQVVPEDVKQAFDARTDLLRGTENGQEVVTTQRALEEERAMLGFARTGKGACSPLVASPTLQNRELGPDQRTAVEAVLTAPDRVIALRGGAGTGKSWMAKEAVEQIAASGRAVAMLAPSAAASRGVLRDEGFSEANTVASFLGDREWQDRTRDGVIWVDEAGLMGAATMNKVFAAADRINARVVLAGDTRQHVPVERGDALRILERHGGLEPATLSVIRRQKSAAYREAVEAIQEGRHKEGFDRLEAQGSVIELGDREERHAAMASAYADAVGESKSVHAAAPTHREARAATNALRSELKARGMLPDEERTFVAARALDLTEAERSDPASYMRGQLVQFVQNARGFKRGSRYLVAGRNSQGEVKITDAEGTQHTLPRQTPKRFEVFEVESAALAQGERIRITMNGQAADGTRLNRGDIHRVHSFTPEGDIVLDNKKRSVLPGDFAHLTHGYVTTSYGAQGRTVDRVFIAHGQESLPATSAEQFYVSASRGRESVAIYTDHAAELREAVTRSGARTAAVDIAGQQTAASAPQEHAALLQRLKLHARAFIDAAGETIKRQRDRLRGFEPDFP